MSADTTGYTEMTHEERLALWTEQARICERDNRPDLAALCWGYVEEYERATGPLSLEVTP